MAAHEYWIQEETTTDMKSCVVMQQSCTQWWDMWQQYAYMQLSIESKEKYKAVFNTSPTKRAEIISGIYARFYLEKEKFSNPKLIGRYYWMGLGAFASKTVAYSFRDFRTNYESEAKKILEAGNFWLFMDVSPWHWGYNQCEQSFQQCFKERNYADLSKIHPKVKTALNGFISYFGEQNALNEINAFRAQDGSYLMKAFSYLPKIENLLKQNRIKPLKKNDKIKLRQLQFDHLLQLANHEQRVVLQPLCWNKKPLIDAMKKMRLFSLFSPDLKLVLTEQEDSKDPRFISTPKDKEVVMELVKRNLATLSSRYQHAQYIPDKVETNEDFRVEDVEQRMIWIVEAAKKYHELMDTDTDKMLASLNKLANWYSDKLTPKS